MAYPRQANILSTLSHGLKSYTAKFIILSNGNQSKYINERSLESEWDLSFDQSNGDLVHRDSSNVFVLNRAKINFESSECLRIDITSDLQEETISCKIIK